MGTADWDETLQDVDDWISVVGFFGSCGTARQRAVAFSAWFHPLISFERLDST